MSHDMSEAQRLIISTRQSLADAAGTDHRAALRRAAQVDPADVLRRRLMRSQNADLQALADAADIAVPAKATKATLVGNLMRVAQSPATPVERTVATRLAREWAAEAVGSFVPFPFVEVTGDDGRPRLIESPLYDVLLTIEAARISTEVRNPASQRRLLARWMHTPEEIQVCAGWLTVPSEKIHGSLSVIATEDADKHDLHAWLGEQGSLHSCRVNVGARSQWFVAQVEDRQVPDADGKVGDRTAPAMTGYRLVDSEFEAIDLIENAKAASRWALDTLEPEAADVAAAVDESILDRLAEQPF